MSWRMNVRKNRVQDPNSVQLRQQIEKKKSKQATSSATSR